MPRTARSETDECEVSPVHDKQASTEARKARLFAKERYRSYLAVHIDGSFLDVGSFSERSGRRHFERCVAARCCCGTALAGQSYRRLIVVKRKKGGWWLGFFDA